MWLTNPVDYEIKFAIAEYVQFEDNAFLGIRSYDKMNKNDILSEQLHPFVLLKIINKREKPITIKELFLILNNGSAISVPYYKEGEGNLPVTISDGEDFIFEISNAIGFQFLNYAVEHGIKHIRAKDKTGKEYILKKGVDDINAKLRDNYADIYTSSVFQSGN